MYKYCNGLLSNVTNRLYVKNKDVHSHNTINISPLRIHRTTVNFTTNNNNNIIIIIYNNNHHHFNSSILLIVVLHVYNGNKRYIKRATHTQ